MGPNVFIVSKFHKNYELGMLQTLSLDFD